MNFALKVDETCHTYPDKTCVIQDAIRLTFGEMANRANRLAAALVGMGVKPGDRVAVFQTNCFQFCEMTYAIGKVGAISANLNFRFRSEEVSYIINNCTPKVLIFGDRYTSMISGIRSNLPSIRHYVVIGETPVDIENYEHLLSAQSPTVFSSINVEDNETACLIYTSGTTGHPKGAMLTHANVMTPITDCYTFEPGTLLLNVPMYHIAGVVSTLLPLYRGDTQVILPQFETGACLDLIEKEKVATTYLVPTMLQGILDHPDFTKRDLSSLKHIGYGASPMPVTLLMQARKLLKAKFTNFFGMTESTGIISVLTPEDHILEGTQDEILKKTKRLGSIGRCIPEGEVRIVDEQDNDVPVGTVGEIIARGKKVMKGYWNKPESTEETLRGGWLHTGDLACMDDDGFLYLAGRKKDMIIRGGENIYPAEIESVLQDHPKILESAVIGVPDDYWGEIVKAIIVLKSGEQVTSDEIMEYCRGKLASYKKPAIVEFVDSLPKNAMQKVLKNVLRGESPK